MIEEFLNLVMIPKIPVPKFYQIALELKDNLLDFHQDYTEFGLLFEFTQNDRVGLSEIETREISEMSSMALDMIENLGSIKEMLKGVVEEEE